MRKLIPILALAALSAGIFALGSLRRGSDEKPLLNVADEVALSVSVATPKQQRIIQFVQAPGDVEATLEVEIRSEIVAKIEEMPVQEGDFVKKGDLLCRLNDANLRADQRSAEARIGRIKASISDAEADLEKAEQDYRRQLRLTEVDATSEKERQDYVTALKKSRAVLLMRQRELDESEAYLQRIREDLKKTIITSPIDGVISRLSAKRGEVVVTGTMNNPGTVIMTVTDLSRMQVRARVDEVDVPLVKAGQKARVYLQSDQTRPVPASVVRVASKSTRQVGRDVVSFETLLEVLSSESRIRPGMTANVEIEVARKDDAVTVPVEAIVHRMRKDLPPEIVKQHDARRVEEDAPDQARQAEYIKVLYVMEKDAARVRLADIGIADSNYVELKDGAKPGETVIIGPYRSLDQLKEGRKVALLKEEKKPGEEKKAEEDKHLAEGDKGSEGHGQG